MRHDIPPLTDLPADADTLTERVNEYYRSFVNKDVTKVFERIASNALTIARFVRDNEIDPDNFNYVTYRMPQLFQVDPGMYLAMANAAMDTGLQIEDGDMTRFSAASKMFDDAVAGLETKDRHWPYNMLSLLCYSKAFDDQTTKLF